MVQLEIYMLSSEQLLRREAFFQLLQFVHTTVPTEQSHHRFTPAPLRKTMTPRMTKRT